MSEIASSWAWTWHAGDEPLGLTRETRALPIPAPGEALIRNRAIGLNPVDWKVLGAPFMTPGYVPGVDGAGVVAAVGDGVPPDWLGQRVAYHQNLRRPGSFAEHTSVAVRALMRLPETLEFADAAAFPCPGLTAWLALEKIPGHPGDALLVSGAGGSVGHYLVQIAGARGWTVTAMCHPRHWERLHGLGASACVEGPLPEGQTWPAGTEGRFHAVIDAVGSSHAARLAPALKANGHLVCIQGRVAEWPSEPFGRALSLHEVALGALHQHGDADDWQRLVHAGSQLLGALAARRIAPEIRVERPFADLPRLLEELRRRNFSGKPIILL